MPSSAGTRASLEHAAAAEARNFRSEQCGNRASRAPLPAIHKRCRATAGGNGQDSQRIPWTRRAPQPLHRIVAMTSRTRASSPCRATRAATATSPECPQPHVIRSVPPRRRPSRRPSRRSSRSCRDAASAWSAPDGRSLSSDSRVGFATGFGAGFRDRNLLDGIPCDRPTCTDPPERTVIRSPFPMHRHAIRPDHTGQQIGSTGRRANSGTTVKHQKPHQTATQAVAFSPGKWKAGTDRIEPTIHPARLLRGRAATCSTRTSGSCC